MMALRIATIACALLLACTTDFDRFKIGASGLPNGVKAGDGASEGDAGGTDGGTAGTRAPRGGESGAGTGGRGVPGAGRGGGGGSDATPQGGGGAMAGTGGSPGCDDMTVYEDGDEDGYGDAMTGRPGCEGDGWVLRSGDCADDDSGRNPDAEESCDTDYDDNCNDAANEGCACTSGTSQPCGTPDGAGGFLDRGECEIGTQPCVDGKWSDDCQGAVGPANDVCNTRNDDCDEGTDEGVLLKRWVDGDGDLYGSTPIADGCQGESGVAYQGGDCNDDDEFAYPGAPEGCGRAGQLGDDCNANTVLHCPPQLPATPAGCPALVTASSATRLFGLDFRLWVGTRNETTPAPVLIHFHGTGSTPNDVMSIIAPANITDQGGIVIGQYGTTNTGTGDQVFPNLWYTGDYPVIDQVLGCALGQLNIDPRRIYVSGLSSGGLQAAVMAFQRSGYVAGVMTNSGGLVSTSLAIPQNPNQVPAVVAMHGAMGQDVVVVDFAILSRTFALEIAKRDGFAVDCDHGGGHALAPVAMRQGAWQVMLDHPYGAVRSGYVLPSALTGQCSIVTAP